MTTGMMRTYILLAGLVALFGAIGGLVGGSGGMLIALGIGAAMNLYAYFNADKIVLRMYKAQPAAGQYGWLEEMVAELADNAAMPRPRVYIIPAAQPNAFATGRNPDHGVVAFTEGLIAKLSRREIRGVAAHELAHIKNRDTLVMTVTATIAGAISNLAQFAMFFGGGHGENRNPIATLALAIMAPLAAMLVQSAISRTREYEADRIGAAIARDPEGLAMALASIHNAAQRMDYHQAEDQPATAHLFIINPLHAHAIDGLFSTHPATQKRIERLMALAASMADAPHDVVQNDLSLEPKPARVRRKGGTFGR